jgi:hypothetical protein
LIKLSITASVCGFLALCVLTKAQAQNPATSLAARRESDSDLFSVETYGRGLLASGPAEKAVTWLKAASEEHPRSKVLRWLLARAYLEDSNDFWALRTLSTLAELYPKDCEPWLWIAWVQLRQGALDEAREALSTANCRQGTVAYTRQVLLLSMLEQNAGAEKPAKKQLAKARQARALFAEDSALLERLTGMLDPGYQPPFTVKAELSAGWSSNSRAGSPTDTITREQDASSPVEQASVWSRFLAPTGRAIRPSVEVEAHALFYSAHAGQDLSYLLLDGRPGLFLGGATPNGLIAYRYESLLLAGGDRYDRGPVWFYEAHRGEIEFNVLSSLAFFGGAGRRLFRETGRSRTEFDGGLGGSVKLGNVWRLMGALSARRHDADKAPYDLVGGSLLLSTEARLPAHWSARVGAMGSIDSYPRSAGYFDPKKPKSDRRDVLIKLSASGFSPPFAKGIKAGVTYEYAERFSTVAPYAYRDQRVLIKLLGSFSFDPWLPAAISPADHVAINYGLESTDLEERVQDLLRRDESVQRSSSCVE